MSDRSRALLRPLRPLAVAYVVLVVLLILGFIRLESIARDIQFESEQRAYVLCQANNELRTVMTEILEASNNPDLAVEFEEELSARECPPEPLASFGVPSGPSGVAADRSE